MVPLLYTEKYTHDVYINVKCYFSCGYVITASEITKCFNLLYQFFQCICAMLIKHPCLFIAGLQQKNE